MSRRLYGVVDCKGFVAYPLCRKGELEVEDSKSTIGSLRKRADFGLRPAGQMVNT